MRTVLCESQGYAAAYNPLGFYGWWQIDYWFEGWDDSVVNTERAWWKWQGAVKAWGDGRHPWPWCG